VNDLTLRTHPELLVDSRGHALRASWHPDEREVVLGVWDDRCCVGTVRLDPRAAARLGAFLVASLGAAAEPNAPVVAHQPQSWIDRWQRLRDRWWPQPNH
jgi:hypothetical protein